MSQEKSAPKENRKLNPDIAEVDVGIKELRTVTIYPLSITDQFNLTDTLSNVINEASSSVNLKNNEEALEFLKRILSDNLMKILEYVAIAEERPTMDELTNNQFYAIVDAIFVNNYEGMLKNFKDLFMRVRNLGGKALLGTKK